MGEETMTLDYPRLWKTLMRTGIKERFSQIRLEFFMKIATDGACEYKTEVEKEKIIEDSEVFSLAPNLVEYMKLAIPEGCKFKHHAYKSPSSDLLIEYFANTSTGIPKEFVDFVTPEDCEKDYNIDGHCTSMAISDVDIITESESDEDSTLKEDKILTSNNDVTVHLIVIGEGENTIEPEMYPMIIKHELTHACLFEIRTLINKGYYKSIRIPGTWTDEDINNWDGDIEYLADVLKRTDEESENFVEFVCEFLMYESDGVIKVKNPVKESKVPKNVKSDSKPKVTYRTVTPYDRFNETIDMMEDDYGKRYATIMESLRECYQDYDAFLEAIRM